MPVCVCVIEVSIAVVYLLRTYLCKEVPILNSIYLLFNKGSKGSKSVEDPETRNVEGTFD